MPRNRVIQVRVTEKQFKRIQLRKESLGYKTLAQFVRDVILKDNLAVYRMISGIYKKVCFEK
ncbi:hypothetical protein CO038_03575 [Candidatus Pacearchaeota archaeon CG_4_9_14_0_2_um_filter_39_13]|nr:hypothetical protein [Candidatus Pacearchaeota archaeon]OIO44340.1 MAG: hypothetical protein AUJ64_00285 [Candidatus Pacearchaeota archaeon CG1_02_39_14]PJC44448.1 MAG: hypothetical protein CO038_03575 [Candidatus Pacearchaeota archaeon CG_4_9_14_0_2_um_filter_39_13]